MKPSSVLGLLELATQLTDHDELLHQMATVEVRYATGSQRRFGRAAEPTAFSAS